MRGRRTLLGFRLFVSPVALAAVVLAAPAAAAPGSPQVVRFHGGGYDQATAVAVDAAGNVYAAGSIEDGGTGAAFGVVKFDRAGTVRWAARYEGSAGGVGGSALAVTADGAGNVYAAGYVGDGVIFNTNFDFLVVKFGPTGTEQWARRYDGPARGFDQATEVVVDANGNVYVSGFSYGQNQNQAFDWSTHKYSPTGTLLWQRAHSGPGTSDDRVADMVLAPDGKLVVTGFTKNTGDGMTNDVDTVAYDPAGNVAWQASWTETPTSHESPHDLDVDTAGRIAITGTTAENPSPYVVPSPVTLIYSPAGALLQAIPGAGGDSADFDAAGNLVVTGFVFDSAGGSAVTKFDASGTTLWRTPLDFGAEDVLSSPTVRADAAGAVTVAGTVTNVFTHSDDYLTIRLGADGAEQWRHRFNGPIGGRDTVAGLALDGSDAVVAGTSWNNYGSLPGGTADDIVTLRFAAGAVPALMAPSDLDARGISRSQIRLGWQDHAGTEDGFRIERCAGLGCSSFAEIAVVAHDTTEFVDGGLARNSHYTYRVRAFDGTATSGYTNTATGKTTKR